MGLLPLEYSDCLLDSPYFRENLKAHERQLDAASADIKTITRDIQAVLEASKALSRSKRALAASLANFRFDCSGSNSGSGGSSASLSGDEVRKKGLFLLLENKS